MVSVQHEKTQYLKKIAQCELQIYFCPENTKNLIQSTLYINLYSSSINRAMIGQYNPFINPYNCNQKRSKTQKAPHRLTKRNNYLINNKTFYTKITLKTSF